MRDGLSIGVDVGTSSTTAVLFDPSRGVLRRASFSYGVRVPRPGWAEQDPRVWWEAVESCLSQLDSPDVSAIAVSGQGAALVLLDAEGEPVRPALIHLDQRASGIDLGPAVAEAVRLANGNTIGAWNVASKLAWIREHEPSSFAATHTITSAAGSVLTRLSGQRVQSASDAGISDLFDRPNRVWSLPVCAAVGLDPALLPQIVCATAVVSGRFVAGGEDTSSAALACGVLDPGDAYLSLGTAGVVGVAIVRGAAGDPRLLGFPHVCETVDLLSGSMSSAGGALAWWSSVTGCDVPALLDEAASVPSAGGAVFLPYLAGELHPVNDPLARGVFGGLSLSTGRAELTRAIVEGSAGAIAHNLSVAGMRVRSLSATGKPSRSPLWMQAVADATGVPVEVVDDEGAAVGDAILALSTDDDEAAMLVRSHRRVTRAHEPDPTGREPALERQRLTAALYEASRSP